MIRACPGEWKFLASETAEMCLPLIVTALSDSTEDVPGLMTVTWRKTRGVSLDLACATPVRKHNEQRSSKPLKNGVQRTFIHQTYYGCGRFTQGLSRVTMGAQPAPACRGVSRLRPGILLVEAYQVP